MAAIALRTWQRTWRRNRLRSRRLAWQPAGLRSRPRSSHQNRQHDWQPLALTLRAEVPNLAERDGERERKRVQGFEADVGERERKGQGSREPKGDRAWRGIQAMSGPRMGGLVLGVSPPRSGGRCRAIGRFYGSGAPRIPSRVGPASAMGRCACVDVDGAAATAPESPAIGAASRGTLCRSCLMGCACRGDRRCDHRLAVLT